MKENPKAEVRKSCARIKNTNLSASTRPRPRSRPRSFWIFEDEGRRRGRGRCMRFMQSLARILRSGCWLLLGFEFLEFALLAQTNPATSDDLPPLRPPRPEIVPSFWDQHQLAIVLAIIVFLAAVCAGVWILLRPKPPLLPTPAARARAALEPLRGQPETGLLLSQTSRIIRSYFAAAFHLPVGELTTTEFCRLLQNGNQITPELSAALSEFLRQCDLRKFAPLGPLPPMGAVSSATELIQQAEVKRAALLSSPGPA